MKPYQIKIITDKIALRTYFSQDRPLYAYALGDLEETMWSKCTYIGAFNHAESPEGLALVWRGVNPPVLLMFGSPEGAEALLPALPDKVFYMLPHHLLPVFSRYYDIPRNIDLWRMHVTPTTFTPPNPATDGLRRLIGADIPLLHRLFAEDGPRPEEIEAISTDQIENGVFFGIEQDQQLVAIAGSHITALEEGVGAVGYVYTKSALRGKGYATMTTAAVTQMFFEMNIQTVILNVAQPNLPAIQAYEKLGYTKHAHIVEGYGYKHS